MHGYYFYAGISSFALGVCSATFFDIGVAYMLWSGLVAVMLFSIGSRGSEASARQILVLLTIVLTCAAIGMYRTEAMQSQLENHSLVTQLNEQVTFQGVVIREPDVRNRSVHLYIQVADDVLLATTNRYTNVSYGDRISVTGMLTQPESFETDLGRTFNYAGYLQARGVSYMVRYAEVSVVEEGQGFALFAALYVFKDAFINNIRQVIAQPQVGLAEGLLLGVKQSLGDSWETVFRKTGIIHIVVLSGYNVMLVVLFIMYVLSYLLPYRARLIFGMVGIVLFAILVGLSATVVRASVMASILLLLRFSGNTYNVLRGLMLAGVVMLIINPLLLVYDPGFQLSFLATLGLILLAPHIERFVQFLPKTWGLREFFVATVATQIFVTPLLLYSIGELSLISVIVNVLVLPMVPVAMLLTFITGLLAFISMSAAAVFAYPTYVSLSYILYTAHAFAQIPLASITVAAFPFWIVCVLYGVIGYLLYRYTLPQKNTPHVPLAHWTIEEEEAVRIKIAASQSDAATEVPVFFR